MSREEFHAREEGPRVTRLPASACSAMDVSVIVPLHNEEENVAILYEEISAVLDGHGCDWELLLIDDGSTDGTCEAAKAIAMRDNKISFIRLRRRYGQTAAIQAGFDHARGDALVTMDGDLENDPRDIPRLLEGLAEGYDVVCGWRVGRRSNLLTRRIPSWVANWIIGLMTGIRIHDHGCTLKAYRGDLARSTKIYSDMHRYILVVMSRGGCLYKEVPVHHRPRRFGESKYGLSRIWRVLLDLVALGLIARFSSQPARWFGFLSLPFLVLAVLCSLASAYLYFGIEAGRAFRVVFPGAAVLFTFAFLHLVMMAVVGELVTSIGPGEVVAPAVHDGTGGEPGAGQE